MFRIAGRIALFGWLLVGAAAATPVVAASGDSTAEGMTSPAPWISPDQPGAARFLAQATFGTTAADIAHLQHAGYWTWLKEQFQAPASTQVPYLDWTAAHGGDVGQAIRMQIWTINSVGTPDPSRANVLPTDQLRQRMALALSEIFVVSEENGTLVDEPWSLASYYDLMAKDAFVNYRTLLEDVTKHPAMAVYLSMLQNQKADPTQNIHPDENYAREVMQLFSIGLSQLNQDGTLALDINNKPVPTYSQTTVRGFAAVFTGWNWTNQGCGPSSYTCCDQDHYFQWDCWAGDHNSLRWQKPLQPVEFWHDSTSDKQLLVYPGVALANGVLVHGGNAQAELTQALDNIFHHPNVGPFFCRQLIQRLVTSNPSPAYVGRIAAVFNNNGSGVRGDLQAVVQAILMDSEARSIPAGASDSYGKLREPLIRFTHAWRALSARASGGFDDNLNTYPPIEQQIGQAPLRSPSVFNFFSPFAGPSGEAQQRGLRGPEFQILTDTLAVGTSNILFHQVFCNYKGSTRCWASDDPATLGMDMTSDAALAVSNPGKLLDKYNLWFLSGQMSSYMRGIVLDRMNKITAADFGTDTGLTRIQHALYLILNSPEYSIQK